MNEELTIPDVETDALDRTLLSLFADARPSPSLEDRALHALRADTRRQRAFAGWQRKLTVGLAASVGLGLAGAAIGTMPELPFPGGEWVSNSRIQREGMGSLESDSGSVANSRVDITNGAGEVWLEKARLPLERYDRAEFYKDSGVDAKNAPPTEQAQQHNANLYSYFVPIHGWKFGEGKLDAGAHFSVTTIPAVTSGGTAEMPKVLAASPEATKNGQKLSLHLTAPAFGSYEAGSGTVTQSPPPKVVDPTPATARKIIIRSGDIEFEIDSFDAAVNTVTQLVANVKGGFIATVNSEKLPNGKVKGSIVVRVPPEALDPLVLELRKELGKAGELKGQRIGSQDITKQYTDLESRLKAARTMEERLLKIIAEGKGEIKQLLEAEKELGVWRTKIEEAEGELRYYSNLAALSTLTITLAEKEMRIAVGLTECERVQAGVEVEDVDAAYRDVLKGVTDAKGRVAKAELKQLAAGQFSATLHFDVSPEAAGPLRDRLRQLGRVARLEIDRVQTADAGGSPVPKDAKVKRGDTTFLVQLYNLANIAPRETVTMQVAVADVPTSYQVLQDIVAKAKGRVLAANLNEQDRQNVTAQFDFEIRRSEEAALRAALAAAGEVASRVVTRAAETDAVTDTKVLFRATLFNVARLKPRETTTLSVEVPDVDTAAGALAAQVGEAKGRQLDSQITRERTGQATARLSFAVPLAAASGLVERFKAAGIVRVHQSARDPQASDGPAATARIDLTLTNTDPLVASDDGLWPQIRKGLSFSATALSKSASWVIFGLCVLLPWLLLLFGGYRIVRRLFGRRAERTGG